MHGKNKVILSVVSQVFYYNQAQQYPQIQQDYKDAKKHVDKTDSTDTTVEKAALESIPMFRRIASLPEKIQDGDTLPALGLASLALINLPEDMRDVKAAGGQIKALLKGEKFQGGYDYKNYQHDFSFFRGTLLEPLVDFKKTNNLERANKLLSIDKTLIKTKFGEKILGFLNVEESSKEAVKKFNKETNSWEIAKDINGRKRYASSFECKGSFKAFGKLTARAMNRTTFIGTAVLAALELPKIFKAMNQGSTIAQQAENTAKQTMKSGINFASVTAGIAYGGAIGSKHGGPLGSLIGMGAGAVIGGLTSKKLQEVI